jgi:plasmid stability protein
MPKMVQLRHVPDALHRKLKARAAQEGLSLSDYLIREAGRLVERPTMAEIRARLASRPPVKPRVTPAQAVRIERDSR